MCVKCGKFLLISQFINVFLDAQKSCLIETVLLSAQLQNKIFFIKHSYLEGCLIIPVIIQYSI